MPMINADDGCPINVKVEGPDNAPVLGPCRMAGLVLATGHFRNGVLLTPVTADIITGYLETGQMPEIAAHFTIDRFLERRPE